MAGLVVGVLLSRPQQPTLGYVGPQAVVGVVWYREGKYVATTTDGRQTTIEELSGQSSEAAQPTPQGGGKPPMVRPKPQ